MRRMLAGESESYAMEKRYQHADGHYIWALLSVSLVRDEAGAPLYFVSQIQDISEQKQINERLTDLTLHDALTGLANRVLFADRLAHAVERSRRSKERVAVLFIDFDRFKRVNDTLGHAAGDELLRQAGERMRRAVRPADTIARLGGDEFTVLCEDLGAVNDAGWVADRLSDTLERPFDLFGSETSIGVSIGIAVADSARQRRDGARQGRRRDVPHEERPPRVARRRMRRWALLAPLAFALLLIPVPGASAATCTVSASGSWTASATWSCHSVPGDSDAVVIPAGKTVSLPDGDGESAASVTIKGGTLALGDSSELDAADFAAVGGGTISGPQYALLDVDARRRRAGHDRRGRPDRERRLREHGRQRHVRRGRPAHAHERRLGRERRRHDLERQRSLADSAAERAARPTRRRSRPSRWSAGDSRSPPRRRRSSRRAAATA